MWAAIQLMEDGRRKLQISIHSSYKQSKSLAREALSLCGRGISQQGAESSAINYAGQILDTFMYSMLWEPALECARYT